MKCVFFLAAIWISTRTSAQVPFSVASNISFLRNFTPKQTFWAVGQNVQASIHLSPKQTGYASVEYYTEEKFRNHFKAGAKSPFTTPQVISFMATGSLTFRQLSLGLKHYFVGTFSGSGTNVYGLAGFGYLFARAGNSASPFFDTTTYSSPLAFGTGKIKRLTFDAGAGAEMNLGSSVYAFADVKMWLPSSDQFSPYLHNNDRVPLALMAGAGIRILFDFTY